MWELLLMWWCNLWALTAALPGEAAQTAEVPLLPLDPRNISALHHDGVTRQKFPLFAPLAVFTFLPWPPFWIIGCILLMY